MTRPAGKAPCPGPHQPGAGWRELNREVCGWCWTQLPTEVRARIRNGIPPGASAAASKAVTEQLRRGVLPRNVVLDEAPVPPGVIACGPDGRQQQLPPEDVAVVEAFADQLKRKEE